MKQTNWLHTSIRLVVILQFLLSLVFPVGALAASASQRLPADTKPGEFVAAANNPLPSSLLAEEPQATVEDATLSVEILSSPYVMYDSNSKPDKPNVFVVEGRVTNTSLTETATDVSLTLTFDDPANPGWTLMGETSPSTRQFTDLAPGESFYGYWFAEYPAVAGGSHTYSMEADAANAAPVSTSTNAHGNLLPGKTVVTRSALDTGNNGITGVEFNVVVGVSFFVEIEYALGQNMTTMYFSPAGNPGFNAAAYRLLSADIVLLDNAKQPLKTVANTTYVQPGDYTGLTPAYALARFQFIAVKLASTTICPYGVIDYGTTVKYDKAYCSATAGTSILIDATISMELTKVANKTDLQQNETIEYTIFYTNTGNVDLQYVWIWDVYNSDILTTTLTTPTPDAADTHDGLVAWFIGAVGAAGEANSKGHVTVTAKADGSLANDTIQDIPDLTSNLNTAFFGIDQGGLPKEFALTSTHTSTIHAPVLAITKTDTLTGVTAGGTATYTINVANNGSVAAQNISLTDTLPAHVTPGPGNPFPEPSTIVGKTLTWSGFSLAAGDNATFTIPVTFDIRTPDQTTVTNSAQVTWKNDFNHTFLPKSATDSTVVNNAVLAISKIAPAKVLAGKDLTYQLDYANTGGGPATNVVITDVLPAKTTFKSCSPLPCGESTPGTVTWTGLSVDANGTGSVYLTVTTTGPFITGDILTNSTYSINSDQFGPASGTAVNTTVENEAAFFNVLAYADLNCSNAYDAGDVPLPGVQINIKYGTTDETKLTQSDGEILDPFRVEESTNVTISAPEVTGYYRSSPGSLIYPANLGTTKNIEFQYISSSDTASCAVLFGIVYDDANHNGIFDPGELGLPNVQVYSIPAADSGGVVTNADGIYRLSYHSDVDVTVYEVNPPGYVSTTPDSYPVAITVPSNNFSPYDFGDFAGIKVTGKVFNDEDASGADEGEDGLAGATVSLGADNMVTGADGLFELYAAVTPGQPLTVSETNPAGYVSTNSIPGSPAVSKIDFDTLRIAAPVAGVVYDDNQFADALLTGVLTVTGTVWEDNGAGGGGLANGLKDGTEPGLSGVTVGLSSGMQVLSGPLGEFTLYGPLNETFTLYSENKPGYTSTNAIPGSVLDSKVDNDTITILSRLTSATLANNLFGDVLTGSVAVVSGKVFDDLNQDGVLNGSETGISGVEVTLEVTGQPAIRVLTSATGDYQFAVNPGSDVRLTSATPGGYYPTTPTTVVAHVAAAGSYPNNNFGFSNNQTATVITGFVFDDVNSNGIPDLGETGLAGAKVTVTGASFLEEVTTFENGLLTGTFTFVLPGLGIYNVQEVPPTGYRHTTPGSVNVNVTSPTSYYVDFGNTNSPTTGSIYGIVFDDLNGNGVQDGIEAGLSGVNITLMGTSGIPQTIVTKAYGQYTFGFSVSAGGYYTVQSEDPAKPGYRSTTPDEVNLFVVLGNSYTVNFGDTMAGYANIMGTVFEDLNFDGHQDPGELGIAGVTVELAPGTTAVTSQFGTYTFPVTTNGLYTVTETDPDSYYSTTDNVVKVNVTAAGNYIVDFGDANNPLLIAFFGSVYDDANVNGVRDASELGLANVPVTLTLQGALNPPYASTTTNEWGQYTFLIDVAGTWFIDAGPLANYTAINANPGSAAVTRVDADTLSTVVTSTDFGQGLGNNQFGFAKNSNFVTVTGMVWEDQDGDTVKDALEPGLDGAVVRVSSGLSQTTADDGLFLLYIPANTAVTLTEEDPDNHISTVAIAGPGNTSTGLNRINVTARNGGTTSAGNYFGDARLTDSGVIKGYVYNDANGNFIKDGESGIPGVTVTLNGTANTITDSDGYYQFVVNTPGIYTVEETDLAEYFSTTPNMLAVQVVIGETRQVNFGDALKTSNFGVIYGVVYDDKNIDAIRDSDELGLAGVKVVLDDNPATEVSTTVLGAYGFKVTTGTHKVRETDPALYQSSTPNLVFKTVANGTSEIVDFGDFLPTEVCAGVTSDSFEPNDTAETAHEVTDFTQAYNLNFFDDPTDWIKFTAQARATYTITIDASFGNRTDSLITLYASDKTTVLAVNDDVVDKTDFSSRLEFTAPNIDTVYYVKISNRSELKGCFTEYQLKFEVKPNPLKYLYLPLISKDFTAAADGYPQSDAGTSGFSLPAAPMAVQDASGITSVESPDGLINHICQDNFEVDDTWEEALPMSLAAGSNSQVHSFDSNTAIYAADKDHVKFSLKLLDRLEFTVIPVDNTQAVIELYDSERTLVKIFDGYSFNWLVPADGEYYLIVSPEEENTAFGCTDVAGYTLNVQYNPVKMLYLPLIMR